MAYLWQNPEWPRFSWDYKELLNSLTELYANQGILYGQMKTLGFAVQSESTLNRFAQEIKNSFEIEGVSLNETSIRSSVARNLGLENVILANEGQLDKNRPHLNYIVEVITDAVHNCNAPLTEERLFCWHKKLFGNPSGSESFNGLYTIHVGQYRTDSEGPMRVISGYGKNETVHFEAPPACTLKKQMKVFFDWFNGVDSDEQKISSVIKSAVAHLYFVELHPFEDGNGRLARVIADMALCRGDGNLSRSDYRTDHLYSMSAQLCKERKKYYEMLHQAEISGSMDITQWIFWYIGCMNRAVLSVLTELEESLWRKEFWAKIDSIEINERQRKILKMLLSGFEGKLTSAKYAKICKCSQDTAGRDIDKLIASGIFIKGQAGGRSTSYELNNNKINCIL